MYISVEIIQLMRTRYCADNIQEKDTQTKIKKIDPNNREESLSTQVHINMYNIITNLLICIQISKYIQNSKYTI